MKKTDNQFYVLKDSKGILRPQVFIARNGEHGLSDVGYYKQTNKLEDGDEIVLIEMKEIKN